MKTPLWWRLWAILCTALSLAFLITVIIVGQHFLAKWW